MRCAGIDLLKVLFIEGRIEQDPLIKVVSQQPTQFRAIGSGQQVGPDVGGADRIGLGLLEVLALIVPADGHGKAESDDESEQRQRCRQDNVEIPVDVLVQRLRLPEHRRPDPRGEPQDSEREREYKKWVVSEVVRSLWFAL